MTSGGGAVPELGVAVGLGRGLVLGVGGPGRHLKVIVDALDRVNQPAVCICPPGQPVPAAAVHHGLVVPGLNTVLMLPALRFSPGYV